MASPFSSVKATQTITQNVEYSIAKNANYSSGSPIAVDARVQAVIDVLAMAAGDILEIRIYKAVNGGTAALIIGPITLKDGQSQHYTIPEQFLCAGWDITVKITTATSRSIGFEVIWDTGDVNTATAGATAVTSIQTGLATSAAQTTAQTDLTTLTGRLTSGRATLLDNLDAAITSRAAAATALTTAVWTGARAALLDFLDVLLSSRAAASTALSTVQWTNARATLQDNLDATVSSRAVAATALSTVQWTNTRAGLVDNLDTAVTTRAAAATALSTAQWTNTRAGLVDHLDADVSTRAAAATAVSSVNFTAARAGYLDNLNIGGNVASSAETTAIQNNTRVVRVVPDVIERPDVGTQTFRVELLLYDSTGNMEAPDSAPTLALVNQSGTDLSARLDSTTMTLVSTGRYRSIYTAAVADALEQLVWTFSVTEGGATRLYGNTSVIVDTSAADFTAADRTKLNTLAADYTTARAAGLDALPLLDVAVSTRAPAATAVSNAVLTSGRAAALDSLDAAVTSRAAASTALSTAVWTSGRAAAIDSLDAAVSTRAPAATAVSSADYTAGRAAALDDLDTPVSSRASSGALSTLQSDMTANGIIITGTAAAVIGIQADTDDIQARLPTALDIGTGSIKAIIDGAALSSIASSILSAVVDVGVNMLAGPVNITVIGALRLLLSEATGKVSGFLAGLPVYRDTADTKSRISGTITSDGRSSVAVDPT